MGHHLVAVCVVCLLCAEHLPCKQHFENTKTDDTMQILMLNDTGPSILRQSHVGDVHLPNSELYDRPDYTLPNKRRGRTKNNLQESTEEEYLEKNMLRSKRHATTGSGDRHKNDDIVYNGLTNKAFVKKIFKQFGDENELKMNIQGFERMLRLLGLHSLIDDQISENDLQNTQNKCISIVELVSRMSDRQHHNNLLPTKLISNGHSASNATVGSTSVVLNSSSVPENGVNASSAVTTTMFNKTYSIDSIKENLFLNSKDLAMLCPILLYKLTAPTSNERVGCIENGLLSLNGDFDSDHDHEYDFDGSDEDRTLVWVYATLSILGISLCGLLGVVVIPFMEKAYYQQILQFFVALAVGTLAGDALLHLLPHAMMTYHKDEDPHLNMTLKGFVATLALIFFFITERALTMIAEWRKRIQKKEKPSTRVRVMRNQDNSTSGQNPTGEKQCKHKYSSYPYCYDEIAMATKDDHHQHNKENGIKPHLSPAISNHRSYKKTDSDYLDTAQNLLDQNNYTISDGYVTLPGGGGGSVGKDDVQTQDNNTVSTNLDDASIESGKGKLPEENYTIILREHEANHHGHSHTHGHVHSPPSSLSAVAWMVVMGDGLHNFTDGMAIGAAFSNNIAGGFSTAIAVFCHELPHELGDFAVLLKAGMSAKQAVYYNLLSSVLSFFGTILGILVGDTREASAWIFACAAGMFIYIALVDMMPELTSSHKDSFAVSQLLLQALGMAIGVGIMLLIAIYEDDLKVIFTSQKHSQHHHHHHHNHR